jgi:hypothetical protein
MANKTWREYALSSGLPLEYSVIQILERLGVSGPSELSYERQNESGHATVFSVDVHGSKVYEKLNLMLDLFIECKYRHSGIKWLFAPMKYAKYGSPSFQELFVAVNPFSDSFSFNADLLKKTAANYPLCSKGVELLANDSNPKAIEQAQQQLRFALVDTLIENLNEQYADDFWTPVPHVCIMAPIIVTTADIWRLKEDASLSQVQNSTKLEDVCTKHDLIVLWRKPDAELRRHTVQRFRDGIDEDVHNRIDEMIKTDGSTLDQFAKTFAMRNPSMFVVMHFDAFEKSMTNLLKFFDRPDIIKNKKKK